MSISTIPSPALVESPFDAAARALPGIAAAARRPRRPRDYRWDGLLIAVSCYVLTAVGNIQLLLPFLTPLRLGLLSALATVVLLLQDGTRARRMSLVMDTPARLIVCMLLWAFLTIPFAIHRAMAWGLVTGMYWKVILLCVAIIAAVRGMRDLERLAFVYLVGVVATCVFAFTNAGLPSNAARMEHITGNLDPNDFATYAVTGFPFGLYFLPSRHAWWKRAIALAGLGMIAIGVVLSGSRGGLLAFIAAGLYVLMRYSTIPLRLRIGSVVLAVGATLAIGSDAYWQRMATILEPSKDYNVTADVGRTQIWMRGIGYAMARPINGVGAASFPWAEGTLSKAGRMKGGIGVKLLAPHNSFVQVFAELGFVGLGLFLSAIAFTFRAIARGNRWFAKRDIGGAPMAQALTASLIGLLVGIFFLSHAYTALLYSVLALGLAYGKIARLERRAERSHLRHQRG